MTVDIEKEKQKIIETDKAFSRLSETHGMKYAFLQYIDSKGVLFRENRFPITGYKEVKEYYSTISDSAFTLKWEPMFADVSKSGDLGYTYGIYTIEIEPQQENDEPVINKGTYITIWKKQRDGTWKWVLDSGNEGLGEEK